MKQLFWFLYQGAIIVLLYTFLRDACPDCAPSAAMILAVLAAFIATVIPIGMLDLWHFALRILQRLRRNKGLRALPDADPTAQERLPRH
jgi:hypothetical protein